MTVPAQVLAAVRSIPHPSIPHPRQEPDMTDLSPLTEFTDRTDATDEEFRARVAVFDAAEEPEEVTVERVARAILHAVLGDTDGGLVLDGDLPASEIARLIVEHGATAALAALRGDRG